MSSSLHVGSDTTTQPPTYPGFSALLRRRALFRRRALRVAQAATLKHNSKMAHATWSRMRDQLTASPPMAKVPARTRQSRSGRQGLASGRSLAGLRSSQANAILRAQLEALALQRSGEPFVAAADVPKCAIRHEGGSTTRSFSFAQDEPGRKVASGAVLDWTWAIYDQNLWHFLAFLQGAAQRPVSKGLRRTTLRLRMRRSRRFSRGSNSVRRIRDRAPQFLLLRRSNRASRASSPEG
jgi:hypothetical protein